MQRRSFLAATTATIAAIAAPAVLAQNGKLTPLKFTLDFRINGQTAPFFLALAKGYYKDEGLDVSIDTGDEGTTVVLLRHLRSPVLAVQPVTQ